MNDVTICVVLSVVVVAVFLVDVILFSSNPKSVPDFVEDNASVGNSEDGDASKLESLLFITFLLLSRLLSFFVASEESADGDTEDSTLFSLFTVVVVISEVTCMLSDRCVVEKSPTDGPTFVLTVGLSLIFVNITELSSVGNVLVCDVVLLVGESLIGWSVTVFSVGVVIDAVCMFSLVVVVIFVVVFVDISAVVVVVVAADISFLSTVVSVPKTDVGVVVCNFSDTFACIVVLLVLDSTFKGLVDTIELDDVVDSDACSPLSSTFNVVFCLFVAVVVFVDCDDISSIVLVVISAIAVIVVVNMLNGVVSLPPVVVEMMLDGVVSLLILGRGGVIAVGKVTFNPLQVASDVLFLAHCQIFVGSTQNSSDVISLYSPTHRQIPSTHVAGYSHSSKLHSSPTKLMSGSLHRPSLVGTKMSRQRHTPSQRANGEIQLVFVSQASLTFTAFTQDFRSVVAMYPLSHKQLKPLQPSGRQCACAGHCS